MIARLVLGLLGMAWLPSGFAQPCGAAPVQVQVLGSGGPELADKRAGSSYLVWIEGKPRVLIDIGGGAALRFSEAGATVTDLDVILLSHLHADHTADLPALISASAAENRSRPLPIFGPPGNKFMPSTVTFVRTLFDSTRGAYRHLGDLLNPLAKNPYKLRPKEVNDEPAPRIGARRTAREAVYYPFANERLRASAVLIARGAVPALAWRIETGGKRLVFSGDVTGEGENLARLAKEADLLIVHHAMPHAASAAQGRLPMPPATIGRLSRETGVKRVVLSHRTRRTPGREIETLESIRKHYAGPVAFANDLDCFAP